MSIYLTATEKLVFLLRVLWLKQTGQGMENFVLTGTFHRACLQMVCEWVGKRKQISSNSNIFLQEELENRWAQRLCSRAIPQPMAHFPFWYNYYFFTVCAVDLLGLSFTAIPDLHPEQKVTKVRSSSSFVWAMKVSENRWKTNARKKEK